MSSDLIDVAIIGGGPAGLTAAATLARQLHTAVVFDSQTYRNAKATKMHMVGGWEGRDPADFRKKTRDDIVANYLTIEFRDVAVSAVEKKGDSHFFITDASGKEYNFRKVILTVGTLDTYPDIEGYAELWTKKIFHCLFCHGYEDKNAPSSGVLGVFPILMPAMILHMAENATQLSEQVTIYTNGSAELADQLKPHASDIFQIETRQIKRLVETGGDAVTVEFADGSSRDEKFLVHNPMPGVQGPFAGQLGLATTQMGDIQADAPMHQTSVRGVFAAGDCITPYKVIPGAISSGCNAAVAAASQLQAEKHGLPPMF